MDDYAGTVMTKKCFNNKKVLLVLDGVEQLGQLARVAGNKNWFGLGSRIIVTTRDERLLEEHDHELYDEFAEGHPESLNLDSRPPCVNNDGFRVCAGCNRNIERGRYLKCLFASLVIFQLLILSFLLLEMTVTALTTYPAIRRSTIQTVMFARILSLIENQTVLLSTGNILSGYKNTAPLMSATELLGVLAVKEWSHG